jgi:hypothetical protein
MTGIFRVNQQRSIRIQPEELIEWNEKQNEELQIKDVSMELRLKIYEKISLAKLQEIFRQNGELESRKYKKKLCWQSP